MLELNELPVSSPKVLIGLKLIYFSTCVLHVFVELYGIGHCLFKFRVLYLFSTNFYECSSKEDKERNSKKLEVLHDTLPLDLAYITSKFKEALQVEA